MRNTNGQFTKGTSGNPLGRPKRADEQFLINLWDEFGKQQFTNAIKNGERWALKALLDKLYPNQKPIDDFAEGLKPVPIISFDSSFMSKEVAARFEKTRHGND